MVKLIVSLIAFMLLSALAGAATLRIEGADAQVEMGKYLNLRIVYEGESKVAGANLQQWADEFYIDLRDSESESLPDGLIRTTQKLRLYPRQPGNALLERIALGGAVAGPLRVNVVPAERGGVDGTPRWLPLPERVWQGQTFEIGVDVPLMHPSNHIALDEAILPGFDVRALPRQEDERDGVEVVRLRWQLTALNPGRHELELPSIEQRGRGRWRFFLRIPEMRVIPLPSYLPPSVPVGRVGLESALIRGEGAPYWQVTVRNQGQLPETTYGIRSALADVAGIDAQRVTVFDIETDPATLFMAQRYRLPLPEWSFGWGQGPLVGLRYFDVDAGQLNEEQTRLPPVWRLPDYAAWVLAMTALVLIPLLLYRAWHVVRRLVMRGQFRRRLAQAPDARTLRALLLADGGFLTLSEWASAQMYSGAKNAAAMINQACFSASAASDIGALKQALRGKRFR